MVSLTRGKLVLCYCMELASVLFAGMLRKVKRLICRLTVNVNCGFGFNPVK